MTATSPTAQNQSWAFPFGPSSRYHQRERNTASHHERYKSAYSAVAPNLATEQRARHRRSHTHKSSVSSASSPPSEYAKSPLSRFSSYSAAMAAASPSTPAKFHRRSSSVQNSPFSDYFTDDARSVDSNVSATETKQLLVRMNKLQSQLMRDSSSESGRVAIKIVASKLDEIERACGASQGQVKTPTFSVEDSGIFSDEEDADPKNAHTRSRTVSEPYLDTANGSMELPPEPTTIEEFRAERDWFILRTQELLDGLRFTQTELSTRFAEVRQLNEEHNARIEERDTQIEQLRSENEGLRSDLGFEYSELLFLKLQMKSLEVDVDSISEQVDPSGSIVDKERHAKKNRILSEMDRWRSDWQDVNGRFRRRRSRYGVSPERRGSSSTDAEEPSSTGEAEWHLQTVKEGHGRVTSLTIKRMDSTYGSSIREETGTADSANPLQVNSSDERPETCETEDGAGCPESHQNAHQGRSEPQIADSPTLQQHQYVEHGTQTETQSQIQPSPSSQDEKNDEDTLFPVDETQQNENEDEYEDEDEEEEEEDCAITSSSETSDVEEEEEEEEEEEDDSPTPTPQAAPKTAWQELWESLQNLTGIDDRFED